MTDATNYPHETFQRRVAPWLEVTFGAEISADITERNHRFLEESLELVQSTGCTASEAHQLVDYVFGRPQGDVNQEAGGVMTTLAALCLAMGIDMHEAAETELARVWTMVEEIRTKQAAKPKHSPLPIAQVKFEMRCRRCHSKRVLKDAYASWDEDAQEWELHGDPFDKGDVCESSICDGNETRIEMIEYVGQPKTADELEAEARAIEGDSDNPERVARANELYHQAEQRRLFEEADHRDEEEE